MFEKRMKLLFFLLGILSIFLCGLSWWLTKTFGEVHILQVLWHIKNAHTLTGFDEDVLRHFMQFTGLCGAVCVLWFFILYKRRSIYIYITSKTNFHFFKFLPSKKIDIFLYLFVIIAFYFIFNDAYYKISFNDLLKIKFQEYSEENDFILHNYYVPSLENIEFKQKNNLIIIMLESMTSDFHDNEKQMSYIPQIQNLYADYQHHGNLINCTGTGWTIASLTAWFFGVPLKLPSYIHGNDYKGSDFLPHAVSVFDIMEKNGYSSYLFMGSSAKFAGTENLFKHGNFTIYDLRYYLGQKKVTENDMIGWGIVDDLLYNDVYEKYLELRKSKEPFVLFMQTIETHSPGFWKKDKEIYGDIRDSWLEADRLLYNFIKKMEPYLETDNVEILIFGDHYPMIKKISFIDIDSSLYTLFAGKNLPQIPESKLTQKINPMDIAPTILQAAGAKWNDNQFGLGISIFSEDKSFSETEGIKALDEKLLYYSKFYDKFF